MIATPVIGALVAQIAFWVLLVLAVSRRALGTRAAAAFVALWMAGYLILPRIAWWTGRLVPSWIALLDIALVFIVFEGDVRLT